ncbi:MAG TPA: hypothetical protein VFM81_07685 [Actinomycetota bacterium]|nr:hypothetical protein [Actinomycetota bacterium]
MGLPPVNPTGAEASIWPAIITAVLFGALLVAVIWTYVRRRPAASSGHEEEIELPRAA